VVSNLHYTFDDAGGITMVSDTASGDNQCFTHDGLGRLVEAWTPATATCGTPSTGALGGPAPYWLTGPSTHWATARRRCSTRRFPAARR
jgi:hypothetical protein